MHGVYEAALHSIESLYNRGSHADGFKGDPQVVRARHREIQLLKSDDTSSPVFHQNDLISRFFTHVFLWWIPKPYGQGIPCTVMENLYLLHTRSHSSCAFASIDHPSHAKHHLQFLKGFRTL